MEIEESEKAAIAGLKEVLKDKVTDGFRSGDVIRWTGGGIYTYCAIKCGNELWSTSGTGMFYGGEQKTYEQITKIPGRSDTSDIAVAHGWAAI